jgi:hypothetical protein
VTKKKRLKQDKEEEGKKGVCPFAILVVVVRGKRDGGGVPYQRIANRKGFV